MKNLKKINKIIIATIVLFTSFKGVLAYEIPQNTFFVNVDTTTLGNIDIWFPADKIEYLFYDTDLQLINIGSSSITGYCDKNNTEYTITFPVFDKPYYRASGYSNTDLNITDLISTNIEFARVDDQIFMNDTLYNKILLMTACVGVFFLCLSYKK